MKEWVRRSFPNAFVVARGFKDQLLVEFRTIRAVGVRGLLSALFEQRKYCDELPIQSVTRVNAYRSEFPDVDALLDNLEHTAAGAHTIYLSPAEWARSVLRDIQSRYPENVGLKLVRRAGSADSAYVLPDRSSNLQEKLLGSHRRQVLVMNRMNQLGLAPKLYDLLEIECGESVCVAYVVDHYPNEVGDIDVCRKFVSRLRHTVEIGDLTLINSKGFDDKDFVCPDCNGNLYADNSGYPTYVDIQNFQVPDYQSVLRKTALAAQKTSHFGDKSHLLGGSYLYQAVPGLRLPAKRDPAVRMQTLTPMLEQAGLNLKDRLVLDVGCNIGLMGAQYLRLGAKWLHGWDMQNVVEQTELVLRAIGCTRFSLTGGLLGDTTSLDGDIPEFIRPDLDTAVISYLAIRGHVGWLASLSQSRWEYMIYEGHEGEGRSESLKFIDSLAVSVPLEVLSESSIKDGTSAERFVAVIRRS